MDEDEDQVECYISALNKTKEYPLMVAVGVTIVYMFSPCLILWPIHCCKTRCKELKIFQVVEMVYNYIVFGSFGIVTIAFITIMIIYTFVYLLPEFDNVAVWALVVGLEFGLLISFGDVYFFSIFQYSRNPFMNIIKTGCCCFYKLYCQPSTAEEKETYLEKFRTHSIGDVAEI